MASLKSLAKDTAIYGVSSIVGRFLNYLLVPLYTVKISAESGGYGVITNVYAYVALLLVILTYGMETTFFRFANKEGEDAQRVYSTSLVCMGFTSLLFVVLVLCFLGPICSFLGYEDHHSYVWTMAVTVALDAFQCIPFAYLRFKHKPVKFASLKMLFVILNITLNILAFVVMPLFTGKATSVGYAFYCNLVCTSTITFFFYKELTGFKYVFDRALMKRMWHYSWPILLLGIAGILNQTADKILFPKIYEKGDAHVQLGIYGAASKIAMIMAMITQAFRYAYEPFVFGKAKDKNSKKTYAKAMKYFLIFTLLAFLMVVGYMNILRYIIAPDYWEGLKVVPIVMAAEIMMGVYFNLSFWYKLIDRTIWGAWFSGIGCAVLILINIIFVPRYGYVACAWAGFTGYATAMILSYIVGQRYNAIRYPLDEMMAYLLFTVILFALMNYTNNTWHPILAMAANTLLIAIFVTYIIKRDLPAGMLSGLRKRLKRH